MAKPVAVLLSDVHYDIHTLAVADAATRQAIDRANILDVPLIVAGDLHNTKANLRGECVNAMLETFKLCNEPPFVLIGNHDRLNEKAPKHSLKFLEQSSYLIEKPRTLPNGLTLIPYQHDLEDLRAYLKKLKGYFGPIIMHQGIQGSNSGEYYNDKTALTFKDVEDFRVISGHYHARQDIDTGKGNTFSYIGNLYTLNFGESRDPQKGFQILMDDGTLEFVPTNLRRHIVIGVTINDKGDLIADKRTTNPDDLVWVKVAGNAARIAEWGKEAIGRALFLPGPFRYEATPDAAQAEVSESTKGLSQVDILDRMIDALEVSTQQKEDLKSLWKDLS